MKIRLVELSNFRKLKSVRLDFADETTVLVGANNSGKTTAMEALRQFLTGKNFQLSDFTLSDLPKIREIGEKWVDEAPYAASDWDQFLPTLDVWIESSREQIHRAPQLVPVLDAFVGLVGVRLRLEPKDHENLQATYVAKRASITATLAGSTEEERRSIKLWPDDFIDFLQRELPSAFHVVSYTLDPSQLSPPILVEGALIGTTPSPESTNLVTVQTLVDGQLPLESSPLRELVQVDVVNAQRGLGGEDNSSRLSQHVSNYYDKHLDPLKAPTLADLDAIRASQRASTEFDSKLELSFKAALDEIARMGYPGNLHPKVVIRTTLSFKDGLRYNSVLKYRLDDGAPPGTELLLELPENLNGLGYQNLVLMIFSLLSFREARLKSGKAQSSEPPESPELAPIHLVLVEEPEAHLHAQVQQVFIRRAYDTLRPKELLETHPSLTTQLIVSTHSAHIAHEIDFSSIRYFRHQPSAAPGSVPTSTVRDLTEVFGAGDATSKFVTRYIRAEHCNLFFADAAILLEGAAERMLVPHFIRKGYPKIRESYVEVLEIGGAHAHRLKSLVDVLGIPVLVITDLDAKNKTTSKKERPRVSTDQVTGNDTLRLWLGGSIELDKMIARTPAETMVTSLNGGLVKFAFQLETEVMKSGTLFGTEVPSTFEDAVGLENVDLFASTTASGLPAKFKQSIAQEQDSSTLADAMYLAVSKAEKAKFALDLMWLDDVDSLVTPNYITMGLDWLSEQISILPVMTVGTAAPAASEEPLAPAQTGAAEGTR